MSIVRPDDMERITTPELAKKFIDEQIVKIKEQVGDGKVLLALSGGVDSSVVAALLIKAIGRNLVCVHVNHGLLRKGEPEQVVNVFGKELNAKTTNVALNHSFTLPNKTKITLKNYRSNIVNHQISFTISKNNTGLSGDIILKGKDDLGNPGEFYLDTADGTNGTFTVDRMTGYISPKATCLTLTPYYNDFPLSSSVNSTEETAESTEKTVAESTEIEVSTTNTDDAQEISISNYKSLGKAFTITIH